LAKILEEKNLVLVGDGENFQVMHKFWSAGCRSLCFSCWNWVCGKLCFVINLDLCLALRSVCFGKVGCIVLSCNSCTSECVLIIAVKTLCASIKWSRGEALLIKKNRQLF
jgi:hypothetical protein